jgi:hypothetical protein
MQTSNENWKGSKVHNYIEGEAEREEGHETTRCPDCCADHDLNLGCDLGIDVAG